MVDQQLEQYAEGVFTGALLPASEPTCSLELARRLGLRVAFWQLGRVAYVLDAGARRLRLNDQLPLPEANAACAAALAGLLALPEHDPGELQLALLMPAPAVAQVAQRERLHEARMAGAFSVPVELLQRRLHTLGVASPLQSAARLKVAAVAAPARVLRAV